MAETQKEIPAMIYSKNISESLFSFKGDKREVYVERMLKELGMEHHFDLMKVRENREWRRTKNNMEWLANSAEKVSGKNVDDVKRILKDYFGRKGTSAESVKALAKIAGEMREKGQEATADVLSIYVSVPKAAPAPKAEAQKPIQTAQKQAPAQKKAVAHVHKPAQKPQVSAAPQAASELGEVMRNYDSISGDVKQAYLDIYFKNRSKPASVSDDQLKRAMAATYGSVASSNDRMFWERINGAMNSLKAKQGAEQATAVAKAEEKTSEALRSYRHAMSGNIDAFVRETNEQYNEIQKSFRKIGAGTMTYRELFSRGTPEYDTIVGMMTETAGSYTAFKSKAVYLSNYLKSGNIDVEAAAKRMKDVSKAYEGYIASLTAVAKRVEEYRVNSPLDWAGVGFDVAITAALVYSTSAAAPEAIAAYQGLRLAAKQGITAATKVALNAAKKALVSSVAKENLGKSVLKAVNFSMYPIGFAALASGGEIVSILDVRKTMEKFGDRPRETVAELKHSLFLMEEKLEKSDMDKAQKAKALSLMASSLKDISFIEMDLPTQGDLKLTSEETRRITSTFVNTAIAVAAIQLIFAVPAFGKAAVREVTPPKVARQAKLDIAAGRENAITNIGSIFMERGMTPKANLADITGSALAQARALKKAGKPKDAEAFLLDVGKELRVFKGKESVISFDKKAKAIIGISPLSAALPQRTMIVAGKAGEGIVTAAKATQAATVTAAKATRDFTVSTAKKTGELSVKGYEKAKEGVMTATKATVTAAKSTAQATAKGWEKTVEAMAPVTKTTSAIYGKGKKIAKGAVTYFNQTVALDEAKGVVVSRYPEATRKSVRRNLTSVDDVINTSLARARTMKKAAAREYLASVRESLEKGFSSKDKRLIEFAKESKRIAR